MRALAYLCILITKIIKTIDNIPANAGVIVIENSIQSKIVWTITGAKSTINLSFNKLLIPKWTFE